MKDPKENTGFQGKRTHASSNVYNSTKKPVKFDGIVLQYSKWNLKEKKYEAVWTHHSFCVGDLTEDQTENLDNILDEVIEKYLKKHSKE